MLLYQCNDDFVLNHTVGMPRLMFYYSGLTVHIAKLLYAMQI